MSNEIKLLMALIDALGFEVETTIDREIRGQDPDRIHHEWLKQQGRRVVTDLHGECTSQLIEPIVSYKLSKSDWRQE